MTIHPRLIIVCASMLLLLAALSLPSVKEMTVIYLIYGNSTKYCNYSTKALISIMLLVIVDLARRYLELEFGGLSSLNIDFSTRGSTKTQTSGSAHWLTYC